MARLTVNIPQDVWDRLAEEAAEEGKAVGTHLKDLIVTRDRKRWARKVSGNADAEQ